jgi:magnesium transporter
MKRFGVDPATSSTPFIASITDTLGVIIYAHVAMVIMRSVIQNAIAHPAAACP